MDRSPDRRRIYGLALQEAARALRAGRAKVGARLRSLVNSPPERLLIAPHDLRTSDPTVANDIYGGYFVFAGKAVPTGGRSPFDIEPPSRAWGEALYGFGWLRDLRAADTALARANARALVDEFIGRPAPPLARETRVVARRLISLLSQSPLILNGADHSFYRRFLRAIGRAVRDLEAESRGGALPYPRLQATIALSFAGLCCEGLGGLLRRSTRALARELDRQILADGGHASRNPRVVVELLLDLLPLRQAYASRGIEAPDALMRAIDRMLPHLRLLRVGNGALSHFNGMGVTAVDHLAALLMYEGAPGKAMRRAPQTGYERLAAGDATLVADVGPAPPLLHSADAHAGCLSFELWSGAQPVVINCGAPPPSAAAAQAARATAAHSTAGIGEESSCLFLSAESRPPQRWFERWLLRRIGPVVIAGPREIAVERDGNAGVVTLGARHEGFGDRFGLTHERRWRLVTNGERLDGEDVFARTGAEASPVVATIRFHLGPGIRPSRPEPDGTVTLLLPKGELWHFQTEAEIRLEDSVFFAAPEGTRRTEQIVLRVPIESGATVRWRFERLGAT